MRSVLTIGLVALAAAVAIAWSAPDLAERTIDWARASTQGQDGQDFARQRHACRDLCDQRAIVEHLGDAYLRPCRARCDQQYTQRRAFDPVQSVTRAPADHRPAEPPAQRIQVAPAR